MFNANVCFGSSKVWHGDLDLTLDEAMLVELAAGTGQITSVLYESDGRFGHEDDPRIEEAVFSAAPTGHTMFDPVRAERRPDGRLYVRPRPRPPRWHWPARPRLWRFWKISTETERSHNVDGTQVSRFVRVGRRGSFHRTPLLVLGLHSWSREARGVWVEYIWYPSGHRGWTPSISGRVKWRRGRIRPYASLRVAPGFAHELRLGVITGPVDFVWG